jgi:hypothetical protein
MKRQVKLTGQQQFQHQASARQQEVMREFASAEEMLRHDAMHTPVPPSVASRLRESLAQLPAPPRSWWQRWFKQ